MSTLILAFVLSGPVDHETMFVNRPLQGVVARLAERPLLRRVGSRLRERPLLKGGLKRLAGIRPFQRLRGCGRRGCR